MQTYFAPLQYDFTSNWLREVPVRKKNAGLIEAFDQIVEYRTEFAECKFEDHAQTDPEQAEAEFLLDIHEAQVKRYDLHWLRETFAQSPRLANLTLAYARDLYPEQEWDIIEDEQQEYAVVSNPSRTLVFDILNSSGLSGGASLVLAGDTAYVPTPDEIVEAANYRSRQHQRHLDILEMMRKDLEAWDKQGVVLPFDRR